MAFNWDVAGHVLADIGLLSRISYGLDACSLALFSSSSSKHRSALAAGSPCLKDVLQWRRLSTDYTLQSLRRHEVSILHEDFRILDGDDAGLPNGWKIGPSLPVGSSRAPFYQERRVKVAGDGSPCFCLTGGAQMNFSGIYYALPAGPDGYGVRPRRISFRFAVPQPCVRRGFMNFFFSSGPEPYKDMQFFWIGHPRDVFTFLIGVDGCGEEIWLPSHQSLRSGERRRTAAGPQEPEVADVLSPPGCPAWHDVSIELDWDTLRILASVDGEPLRSWTDNAAATNFSDPDIYLVQGFRYLYLFTWLESESDARWGEPSRSNPPEILLSDLWLEDPAPGPPEVGHLFGHQRELPVQRLEEEEEEEEMNWMRQRLEEEVNLMERSDSESGGSGLYSLDEDDIRHRDFPGQHSLNEDPGGPAVGNNGSHFQFEESDDDMNNVGGDDNLSFQSARSELSEEEDISSESDDEQ